MTLNIKTNKEMNLCEFYSMNDRVKIKRACAFTMNPKGIRRWRQVEKKIERNSTFL